jgi:perosamine synthetase
MWVRKRFDIGWSDICYGIVRSCWLADRANTLRRVEGEWSNADDALACLSVRSGFDLLLQTANWPKGSEVLMSALTIPDMVRIVKHHEHTAVPIDLDMSCLAPKLDNIRSAINSKTKAIVIAHLFGTRVPLDPIIELAREHGLMVIEDCAQAFDGRGYTGHPQADVSMFSFGAIKSCSALQGALFKIRSGEAYERMRNAHEQYLIQRRATYFRRLLKYSLLKLLSTRPMMEAFSRGCRVTGRSHDSFSNRVAKGFAGPDFFGRIRKQPSDTLLAMLERRLRNCDHHRIDVRESRGRTLDAHLNNRVPRPGAEADFNNYWVFPIVLDDPESVLPRLWKAGFDATQGDSMCVVDPPADRPELQAKDATETCEKLVYLPLYPEMSERCLKRMARILLAACQEHEIPASKAPLETAIAPTCELQHEGAMMQKR